MYKIKFILTIVLMLSLSSFFLNAAEPGDGTGIDSQILWRTPGTSQFVTVESSDVLGSLHSSFGTSAGYYRNAVGLSVNGKDYWSVESVFGMDFSWAVGFMNVFQVGLVMPVIIHQTGDGSSPIYSDDIEADTRSLGGSAVGDMRLHLKARMLGNNEKNADNRGPGIALDVAFALPTGDEHNFSGSSSVIFAPSIIFDFHKLPFSAGLNIGARLRSGKKAQLADSAVGNQFSAAAGFTIHLLKDNLLLSAETNLLAEMDDFRRMGAELRAAVGSRPGRSKAVTLWLSGSGGVSNRDKPLMSIPRMRFTFGLTYVPGASTEDEMDAFFE